MGDIDIEGKIHWSGKERLMVISAGFGCAAIACISIWGFKSQIPISFLQSVWCTLNCAIGVTSLSYAIIALIPRRILEEEGAGEP